MRSNKITKSKCCMSVVLHMFYESFGSENTMLFIFRVDTRKGQCQLEYIKLKFQSAFFFQRRYVSYPTLFLSSKTVISEIVMTTCNAEDCVLKIDLVSFV